MNAKANPIAEKGERNIFCPFYSKCLDYAINFFWKFWSCTQCPHRLTEAIREYEYPTTGADLYCELSPDFIQKVWKYGSD